MFRRQKCPSDDIERLPNAGRHTVHGAPNPPGERVGQRISVAVYLIAFGTAQVSHTIFLPKLVNINTFQLHLWLAAAGQCVTKQYGHIFRLGSCCCSAFFVSSLLLCLNNGLKMMSLWAFSFTFYQNSYSSLSFQLTRQTEYVIFLFLPERHLILHWKTIISLPIVYSSLAVFSEGRRETATWAIWTIAEKT